VFDVAIIGGSIAGSSLATLLVRAGLSVVLLEKGSFPRHKPCGEGLASAGLEVAVRYGLLPSSFVTSHQSFNEGRIYAGDKQASISNDHTRGITVSRYELDYLV
jgi:flavin-dependent dehydrogenase